VHAPVTAGPQDGDHGDRGWSVGSADVMGEAEVAAGHGFREFGDVVNALTIKDY
jgi:hypothetical protein